MNVRTSIALSLLMCPSLLLSQEKLSQPLSVTVRAQKANRGTQEAISLNIEITNTSDAPYRWVEHQGLRVEIHDSSGLDISPLEVGYHVKGEQPESFHGGIITELAAGASTKVHLLWRAANGFALSGNYSVRVCRWDALLKSESCSSFAKISM